MFAVILVAVLSGVLCVVLIRRLYFHRQTLAGASVVVLVYSLGAAWLLSVLYPAGFSSDGIYSHSFWGIRRFARQQDITDARTFKLLNLPCLRIYTTDRKITWLPLFQSHRSESRQEIQRLAPAGSPVLNHLQ